MLIPTIVLFAILAYITHKWGVMARKLRDAESVIESRKDVQNLYVATRQNTERGRTIGYLWCILIPIAAFLVYCYFNPLTPQPRKQAPKVEIPKDTIHRLEQ